MHDYSKYLNRLEIIKKKMMCFHQGGNGWIENGDRTWEMFVVFAQFYFD